MTEDLEPVWSQKRNSEHPQNTWDQCLEASWNGSLQDRGKSNLLASISQQYQWTAVMLCGVRIEPALRGRNVCAVPKFGLGFQPPGRKHYHQCTSALPWMWSKIPEDRISTSFLMEGIHSNIQWYLILKSQHWPCTVNQLRSTRSELKMTKNPPLVFAPLKVACQLPESQTSYCLCLEPSFLNAFKIYFVWTAVLLSECKTKESKVCLKLPFFGQRVRPLY